MLELVSLLVVSNSLLLEYDACVWGGWGLGGGPDGPIMSITVLVSVRALPSVACWYSAFLALSAMPSEAATDWVVRMGGGVTEDRVDDDSDGGDDDEICCGGVNDGVGGEEEDDEENDDDCDEEGEEEEGRMMTGSERVETRGLASVVDTEIGRLASDISLFPRTFPRTFSGTFSRTFPDSASVFLALDTSLSFIIVTFFTSILSSTSVSASLSGWETVDVIGRGEVEGGNADCTVAAATTAPSPIPLFAPAAAAAAAVILTAGTGTRAGPATGAGKGVVRGVDGITAGVTERFKLFLPHVLASID